MKKDFNKTLTAITAAIVGLASAIGVFWESICPILDMCPASEEMTESSGKTVGDIEQGGDQTATEGGDNSQENVISF
jgi:hypothetical protein